MNTRTSNRTRRLRVLASTAIIIVVSAATAAGQTSGAVWRRGTVLAGFAGAAVASPTTKLFAGTGLGWEVSPRLTIEGRGAWLPSSTGPTDFAAVLNAVVPVLPAKRTVPFVSGGIGMYRATIDATSTEVPAFYRQRMTSAVTRSVFEDVVLAFGGGANVFATRHVAIRPEIQMLVVTTEADRRWMPVYAVNLAYHFEAHVIR